MFRKLLTTAAVLFLTVSPGYSALTFYIAPGLSYDDFHVNNNTNTVFQGLDPRIAVGFSNWNIASFYLGAEIFANPITPATINNRTPDGGVIIKPNYTYGISLLPGFHLDDYISLFVRASIIQTRFNQLGTTRNGYQVGGGVEIAFCGQWAGRAEYTYNAYKHFDGNDNFHANLGTISFLYYFC